MRRSARRAAALALALAACVAAAVGCASASPADGEGEAAPGLVIHFVALEGEPVVGGTQVGTTFGCADRLVAVAAEGEATGETIEERIASALEAQLAAHGAAPEGLYDALSRSALRIERIEPVPALPGAYRVHLGGDLRVGGACDPPRVSEQLEATALQFPEVDEVEIFLGEEPLDAAMAARGRQ